MYIVELVLIGEYSGIIGTISEYYQMDVAMRSINGKSWREVLAEFICC